MFRRLILDQSCLSSPEKAPVFEVDSAVVIFGE